MQSLQVQSKLDFSQTTCQDYTIFEHNGVYSKVLLDFGFIEEHEFTLLNQIFETFSQNIRKPDLLIYLHANQNTLLKRIAGRNRPEEQKMDVKYLEKLQQRFDEFAQAWKICPIIMIDTDKYDITDPADFMKVVKILG